LAIKLYNFAFGPYPQRLNIYLAEKKPTNVEVTLFDEPDRRADVPPAAITALTVTGSMPILKDEDGTVIGQSLAILEYLEDKAFGPDMLGAMPAARARTRQFVHMLDEALTFFGLWGRHGSPLGHGIVRTSQDVAEICAIRYFGQLRLIEKMIGGTEFIAGDRITVADCVAMATLQYAADFYAVPVPPECIKLQTWFEHFSTRPSAARPGYPEDKLARAQGLAAYSLSRRSNPDDAIADLRCREGTIMKRIGFYFRDGSRTCSPPVPDAVAEWAAEKEYDVVVWTGLPSNFKDKTGKEFSVAEAISHLQSLTKDGKSMAATYV